MRPKTPSEDVRPEHDARAYLGWQQLRLKVIARKSDFFWRRTDDCRYPCVLRKGKRLSKVLWCGHYELDGCTDEISASCASQSARRWKWFSRICVIDDLCPVVSDVVP